MIMKKLSRVMIAAVLTMVLAFGGVTEAQAAARQGGIEKIVQVYATGKSVVNKGYYDKIYVTRLFTGYMSYSQSDNKFKFRWGVGVDSTNKCRAEVQIREKINGVYTAWTTVGVSGEYSDRNDVKVVDVSWDMSKNARARNVKNGVAEGVIEMRFLVHKPITTGSTTTNITTICPYIEDIEYRIDCITGFMSFSLDNKSTFYFVTKDSNVKELVANRSK